ncbi:MAG TPA: copper resistance protein CopC [Vitreimonas sp.]|jgi:methionine-rich copper-binding protein CopC|nr:copper resistance protein CopC [Vitreimonas sp.]
MKQMERQHPRRHFGLLLASAFFALATPAFAHALLARAEPAVGATVHGQITTLRMRFTERIEPTLCRVTLVDAANHDIPVAALAAEGDGRILAAHITTPLAPGIYHVCWRAVSVDTHITEGDYSFTLAP